MTDVNQRISDLGLVIPDAPAPAANYVSYTISGNTLYISGNLPFVDGKLPQTGKVGAEVTPEEANALARLCGINLISQMKAALDGDLNRVSRILKLGGFVASDPSFTGQPGVINGCSDLMVEVFGEAGRHARSAVASPILPLDTPVEIDAIVEITTTDCSCC